MSLPPLLPALGMPTIPRAGMVTYPTLPLPMTYALARRTAAPPNLRVAATYSATLLRPLWMACVTNPHVLLHRATPTTTPNTPPPSAVAALLHRRSSCVLWWWLCWTLA